MHIPDPDAPPFSPQLLLKNMGHNQDIFRAVVQAMQVDFDLRMARLAHAGAQRDFVTARLESRAFKATLGEITATSAAYLASILERAADARDWETFDLAFGEFRLDANQLREAITAYLGRDEKNVTAVLESAGYPSGPRATDKVH